MENNTIFHRLWCWLFGHDWKGPLNTVPEDRDTYRCERCREYGYLPARVGENAVPEGVDDG